MVTVVMSASSPYLEAYGETNGDGLRWDDAGIDRDEMDEMLEELCDTTGY